MPRIESQSHGPSPMRVVAERIHTESRRGLRNDPWKLLLLVEGGGMAGIITAEMLAALAKRDPHLDSIDVAGGNSAGLLNLAYSLSDHGDGHEIAKGKGIYQTLTEPRFFDAKRFQNCLQERGETSPPIIDMRYLIYDVMGGTTPLDWKAVTEHDLPTAAYITDTQTARVKSTDITQLSTQEKFLRTLELSSTIPWFGNRGGRPDPEGTDGGVGSRGVSIREALVEHPDATHVLVFLSRPDKVHIPDLDPLKSFVGNRLRQLGYGDLGRAMINLNRGYRANLRLMDAPHTGEPAPGNPYIQTIKVPIGRPQVEIMERDPKVLETEGEYGGRAVSVKIDRHLRHLGHVLP